MWRESLGTRLRYSLKMFFFFFLDGCHVSHPGYMSSFLLQYCHSHTLFLCCLGSLFHKSLFTLAFIFSTPGIGDRERKTIAGDHERKTTTNQSSIILRRKNWKMAESCSSKHY